MPGGLTTPQAIVEGSVAGLRPVLMTALTTILGLLPLLLARGIGAEVQRLLAVVIVSGLRSSTVLTLFLIPAMYSWRAPQPRENTDHAAGSAFRTPCAATEDSGLPYGETKCPADEPAGISTPWRRRRRGRG